MKVKIMQRSVYHKYAEIEVEVPKDVDAQEWLVNNEHIWVDVMDNAFSKAKYEFGFGTDSDACNNYGCNFTDHDQESEWLYYCPDGYGGHL